MGLAHAASSHCYGVINLKLTTSLLDKSVINGFEDRLLRPFSPAGQRFIARLPEAAPL